MSIISLQEVKSLGYFRLHSGYFRTDLRQLSIQRLAEGHCKSFCANSETFSSNSCEKLHVYRDL